MACSLVCSGFNLKFQGETKGPLGGGAGALLQSRCGMEEEEAGEGEGKGREDRYVQGEAWKEETKVSAKDADPKNA